MGRPQMTLSAETTARSLILVPLASRRIAFSADSVIELTLPERVQTFPHKTSWIRGVIVRRNRVVPVCDTRALFDEPGAAASRFYLILEWRDHAVCDWCAIPVQGECELLPAGQFPPLEPPPEGRQPSVCGVLKLERGEVDVIDLSRLIPELRKAEESAS